MSDNNDYQFVVAVCLLSLVFIIGVCAVGIAQRTNRGYPDDVTDSRPVHHEMDVNVYEFAHEGRRYLVTSKGGLMEIGRAGGEE